VGAEWIKNEVQRLGIPSVPGPVDIGVRIEAPASILQKLTQTAYEAKFICYSKTFDDKVREWDANGRPTPGLLERLGMEEYAEDM
jgi:uncharacterized FAD-dependent dehydrogenase